jgi:hypothetical protein
MTIHGCFVLQASLRPVRRCRNYHPLLGVIRNFRNASCQVELDPKYDRTHERRANGGSNRTCKESSPAAKCAGKHEERLEGTRSRMERVPNHLSRTRWLRLRGAVDCSPPLKQGRRGFQLSKKGARGFPRNQAFASLYK